MLVVGERNSAVVIRKSTQFLLAAFPSLFWIVSGVIALQNRSEHFIASADPSYNYLVNSYEVMTGVSPFAIHHPGTTLQYLMGVTNFFGWLTSELAQVPFSESIVAKPEWYLDLDLLILIVCQALALGYVVVVIARRWGIFASISFFALVLISTRFEVNIFLVGPVALTFVLALLLVGIVIQISEGNKSPKLHFAFGVVAALGVMTKATFIPMLVFIGIYWGLKGIKYSLWGFGTSLVIFVLLLRSQIGHMGYWFIGIALTSGRNPGDTSSLSIQEKILGIPSTAANAVPLIVVAFLVFLAFSIALKYRRNLSATFVLSRSDCTLVSLAMLASVVAMFLTIKDYRQGDLILLAVLAPLVLTIGIQVVMGSLKGPKVIVLPWILLGIFSFLAFFLFFSSQRSMAQAQVSSDYLAQVEYLEQARESGENVIYAYGVFTPGTALSFGDGLSNHLLTDIIDIQYPRQASLNVATLRIEKRTTTGLTPWTCFDLAADLNRGEKFLIAPGRPIDVDQLKEANGITNLEQVRTFGDWPVYRIQGFDCQSS